MDRHHFISYSSADANDFGLQLANALAAGPPVFPVWLDVLELRPGEDWADQIDEALRRCTALLFVMTRDSVMPNSVCAQEWKRALSYKKPIIPLKLHRDAVIPFRLEGRQHIDFTGDFKAALARLRNHLGWLKSPEGVLRELKDRLQDAQRDLNRATDAAQRARVQADITQLEQQIAVQQRLVDDPAGGAAQVEARIASGLERERQPERPVSGIRRSKFINPPPGSVPSYFQDRETETRLLGQFLQNDALCLATVTGRGGTGKTALVCRLLKALENGHLPDEGGPLAVDGIVYLSAIGSRRPTVPNLFADLGKLLPDEMAQRLDALYKQPQLSTEAKMRGLLEAFPTGRVVVLLDNFEDVVDPATLAITDAELDEALRALLSMPHAVKVIITTRIAPRKLLLVQPGRQRRLDLDAGLPTPYAENILRAMDPNGALGLRDAPDALLAEAREQTRGYPRALEALAGILAADRDTSLPEILDKTRGRLPENVVFDLVGEAYSRLDPAAQQVMQALAVYNRPVTPAAIDHLLQPYTPTIDSAPVLSRLVNMHFARKETGRYYLHPVDRAYAFAQVPEGLIADRAAKPPRFTQFALLHRGAEYFKRSRKPRAEWKTIQDLAPQLAEFELRYAGQDYDAAADVLTDIDFNYLLLWGYYALTAELHERLLGKVVDIRLRQVCLANLGSTLTLMGHAQKAISYHQQSLALAREIGVRRGEVSGLGNLGNDYAELGQVQRAIAYYEQALAIAREMRDRQGEGNALGNLGICYANLGQVQEAIEYYEQHLTITREVGDRAGEGRALGNLALVLIDEHKFKDSINAALQSLKITEEIDSPFIKHNVQHRLALAHFYLNNLPVARTAAEAARQYDEPLNNYSARALLGLIALRQGDRAAAREAFTAAVEHADRLLEHTPTLYDALDAKALALAGLALLEGPQHLPAAIAAYRASREVTTAAGIVGRAVRLLEALAVVDAHGLLAEVRAAASGG